MSGLVNEPSENCRSFPPSADAGARLLILGSMPGEESLRRRQYYAFRHNVFWRIIADVLNIDAALDYPERLAALRRKGVALWDILATCERRGSLDPAIRRPRPNDLPGLLKQCPGIVRICCNGSAAGGYLRRFYPDLTPEVVVLPSTSPAAARLTYAEKLAAWHAALII